jgi:hypothetical protein
MKPQQILKLPLSFLQIFSGAKSFADNPILGNRWLNERGLHRLRCDIAARMAAWRRGRLAKQIDPADRAMFEANGFVLKPDFLDADSFARLRQEILSQPWQTLEMRQGPATTRRAPLELQKLAKRAPTLAQFVQDSRVVDLIRYAASTKGRPIFSVQAILTDGSYAGDDPQTWIHEDTFHAVAKMWFFLHDVAADEGPFFYVPGSHERNAARLDWEYRQSLSAADNPVLYHARGSFRIDEAGLAELGFAPPKPLAVKANTLVVADTSGFHGRTPSAKPTLRIEVYATLRRNPYLPWLGFHVLDLPPLRQYLGSLILAGNRLMSRLGAKKLRAAGGLKPIDAPL